MKEKVLNYVKENIKAISICLVLIVVALGLFFNLDRSISQTDHTEFVYTSVWKKMDIDIDYKKLTDKMIEKMHKHNLKVNVWTVDDIDALRDLEKRGVDYVTSNVFDQNA